MVFETVTCTCFWDTTPNSKMVYRIYVEKKKLFAVDGAAVLEDLTVALGMKAVEGVRVINRYDVEGLSEENFRKAVPTVFSEPPVDDVFEELPELGENERSFAVEFLPGQFDQRADSAAQCIQMLCKGGLQDKTKHGNGTSHCLLSAL